WLTEPRELSQHFEGHRGVSDVVGIIDVDIGGAGIEHADIRQSCVRRGTDQPFDDFIDRRLTPATRTCLAFAGRLEALATRLERATALLRTRIELRGQAQNTALLASVERTGARQLKLQHL